MEGGNRILKRENNVLPFSFTKNGCNVVKYNYIYYLLQKMGAYS